MTETERIRDQLRRAFEGDAWHGPGVLELLENVTASQAAARPIAGAHSIWELVVHIQAWEVPAGAGCKATAPSFLTKDWTVINDTSDEAWEKP